MKNIFKKIKRIIKKIKSIITLADVLLIGGNALIFIALFKIHINLGLILSGIEFMILGASAWANTKE